MEASTNTFYRLVLNVVALFYGKDFGVVVRALLQSQRTSNSRGRVILEWQTDESIAEMLCLPKSNVRSMLEKLREGGILKCVDIKQIGRKQSEFEEDLQAQTRGEDIASCGWGIDFDTFIDNLEYRIHSMEKSIEQMRQRRNNRNVEHRYVCKACGLTLCSSRIMDAQISQTGQLMCPSRLPQCAGQELEDEEEEEQCTETITGEAVDRLNNLFQVHIAPIKSMIHELYGVDRPIFCRPKLGKKFADGNSGSVQTVYDSNELLALHSLAPVFQPTAHKAEVPWFTERLANPGEASGSKDAFDTLSETGSAWTSDTCAEKHIQGVETRQRSEDVDEDVDEDGWQTWDEDCDHWDNVQTSHVQVG